MRTAGPACILALLLGLFFGPVPWASAELRLDARFGDGGVVRLPVSTRGDWVSGANRPVRQPDGKLLVAVGTATDRAPMQTVLLRFLRNGRLDRAFGHNGRLRLGSPWFATHDMQLQPDGRIVLLGATGYDDHALYGSPAQVGVIRLMADGSRDGSFGTNGAAVFNPPWHPDTLILKAGAGVLQALFDGRFLIPMSVEELRRDGSANVLSSRTAFMRLDPDGSVDDSFGDGGVLNVPPEENAVGASWEALPGGDFAALLPGMTGAEVRRYGVDGRLDRGFGDDGAVKLPPGGPWSLIEAVARDGSLLASGSGLPGNRETAPHPARRPARRRFRNRLPATARAVLACRPGAGRGRHDRDRAQLDAPHGRHAARRQLRPLRRTRMPRRAVAARQERPGGPAVGRRTAHRNRGLGLQHIRGRSLPTRTRASPRAFLRPLGPNGVRACRRAFDHRR